jgi:hypothetical protein
VRRFNRVTAHTILKKRQSIIKELHEKMFRLADNLWPKYMKSTKPSDTLQLIKMYYRQDFAATYYTPKFQLEIEKQIPELVAYVKAKDLLILILQNL